jgi:polyisoprenoid-binding protein YceI
MSRIILCFSFLVVSFTAVSQRYNPSDAGSKIHFTIKNFGISTGGDISGLTGNIIFAPSKMGTSIFDVSVNVNTIDTDNEKRDNHLKSADYFNVERYPLITIKSTRINKAKAASGKFIFTGTISMHGISKSLVFPFTATKKGEDYLFAGEFKINRLDYGVGKRSSVLSDAVKVTLSVLAKKS